MSRTLCFRILFWLAILMCLGVAVCGRAQSANLKQPAHDKLVGVWQVETDGLPAVTMVISDEGGSLTGAILFYIHMRQTPERPFTSSPGLPEPMFNIKFDGETLTFQVSHRRAHAPHTLADPPITLQLKLTGTDENGRPQGEMTNVTDHSPVAVAVRTDY